MPSLLIFSINDIGQNFRLLRHAKSFSSLNNSIVTIFAPEISSLPKEIEKSENIKIHYLYVFHLPYFLNLILLPFLYLFIQFQCIYFYLKSSIDYDFIISNPWPFFNSTFSFSLSRLFKAKLIYDISIFKFSDKNRLQIARDLEKKVNRAADFRICSSRALQVFLELQKLSSSIIHDPPGNQFFSEKVVKKEVFSFLGISERNLIGILMPIYNADFLSFIFDFCERMDQEEVKNAFIIFGNPKTESQVESIFNKKSNSTQNLKNQNNLLKLNLKYSSLHFVPINTDAYSNILSCCDVGILLNGSKYGFDYTPELTELIACKIPIIVGKGGCMTEVVENGKNGFIFQSKDQLFDILSQIFIEKTVDLNLMKESSKNKNSDWDVEWKNFFDPLLEETMKK